MRISTSSLKRYGKTLFLAVASVVILNGQTNADMVAGNDRVFGSNSITIDTDTRLDWLDVNLSVNRSFNDVAGQFGPGGIFSGWRHANISEITSLFEGGNIRATSSGLGVQNVTDESAGVFNGLFGATEVFNVGSAITGFFEDGSLSGKTGIAQVVHRPVTTNASTSIIFADSQSRNLANPTLGNWLVRPSVSAITVESTFQFRDVRSANSVGFTPGDRVTFGVNVTPNGDNDGDGFADSNGSAPPTRVQVSGVGRPAQDLFFRSFNRFVRSPEFLDGTGPFGRDTRGGKTLTITNGPFREVVLTPNVVDVDANPFVENMSLTGSGVTPTFNWTVPDDADFDTITIKIFDLENFVGEGGQGGAGVASIAFIQSLSPVDTSFTVPAGVLLPDHLYSVSIELDDQRTPQPEFTPLESRSRSFFDFSTALLDVPGNAPVFLPTVDPTGTSVGTPIYSFDIDVVDGQTVFIDPFFAIGYDYEIGAGDPLFASVLLPDIGDGEFELWLFDMADNPFNTGITILANTLFDFTTELGAFGIGAEGLDKFRILGIETTAELDPIDTTAFVTGLTFVGDGTFTGTMTPIVVFVPEPGTLAIFGLGLAGLAYARRRQMAA